MNSTLCPLLALLAGSFFWLAPFTRAQEDPLKDPELQEMLKDVQELRKEAGN